MEAPNMAFHRNLVSAAISVGGTKQLVNRSGENSVNCLQRPNPPQKAVGIVKIR
jgi:hypothetical protein